MKRAGVWNVQTGDNIVACITKSGSDKSAEFNWKPLEHGCANHAAEGKCFCPPSAAVT